MEGVPVHSTLKVRNKAHHSLPTLRKKITQVDSVQDIFGATNDKRWMDRDVVAAMIYLSKGAQGLSVNKVAVKQ